ncbi:hypothetical protein FRC91_11660 [Bradymonadales bacterium TMQ1]|uniref:Uncharacterized protein n=1 Tax=Lujinxingia sediminis TaxID=2480984 RepID=A0ABY0CRK5_9DELT|nr:hypothetical protein [Lujinxingia sediminis]RVU42818.1 hypothetical protein EA187_15015 [Lujinxingia sediminis]TXC75369.1 hypothetical protein FRC91_11660 [Bradymonadales bacterium TMQ1]
MHIDASYIKEIRSREGVFLVEQVVMARFSDWFDLMPWCATSIDWNQVPGFVKARIPGGGEVWEGKVCEWASGLPIGKCSHIVPYYRWKEPSIALPFHFGIANLDLLYATYPNKAYVFGVDVGTSLDFQFGTVFEWDQMDTFRGSAELIDFG